MILVGIGLAVEDVGGEATVEEAQFHNYRRKFRHNFLSNGAESLKFLFSYLINHYQSA